MKTSPSPANRRVSVEGELASSGCLLPLLREWRRWLAGGGLCLFKNGTRSSAGCGRGYIVTSPRHCDVERDPPTPQIRGACEVGGGGGKRTELSPFSIVAPALGRLWDSRALLPPAPEPALLAFSHADQSMDSAEGDVLSTREQLFHERVRECLICALLFASLYILCYFILTRFKRHTDFTTVDEDAAVNRIALWLCTFTLAVSLGAVLLLPFSIISNEVLLTFPQNYYIQWLNGSLIHGLWNLVFLFSNLSLVFLMPFAYFFTESEGFAGSKKGIMARVYETFVVLLLLTLLVLGMVWVASAILDNNAASRESLYDLWEYYLPYLYSCISLFGVLLLLLCTPFGLSRMFTVTGTLLVKPRLLEDLDEQLNCTGFEEAAISRKIHSGKTSCWLNFDMEVLRQQYLAIHAHRITLETRRKASAWQRNLGYPLAMLSLLSLTGISVLVVCFHVLELLLDDAAMPRGIQDAPLGKVSFSVFGSFGAAMQVILIFYLMISSVVGFYSSPLFTKLLPEQHDTAMTKIIGNCVSLLVLSSALPVLSRTLGITRFDLLGDFGRFNWLGNFYIVFLYNMLFAGLTTLCLVKKFTWAVQAELIRAFGLHKLPLPVTRSHQPCKLS
ncbi:protein LMBR1L [Podarcis raffonei]|uniref:protein LMBR1L n=1 Tax=Podarcis raffonei TaxID=65483 RepID=UPI0023299EBF|nr:protein LMBR1L [Podarcis raffonei]